MVRIVLNLITDILRLNLMKVEKNPVCPECKTENTLDSSFCKKCGYTLDEKGNNAVNVLEPDEVVDETSVVDFKINKNKLIADRYLIISELGRGAMGIVYKAWDQKLERYIALKTIKFDQKKPVKIDEFRKRLISEAKAVAKLKHPRIVTIHDAGVKELSTFIAMEYIDGYPLSDIIKSDITPDLDLIVDIIIQVCEAISHAHAKGIVHRDLKPGNIMLENDSDVKITDFGIAKMIEEEKITLSEKKHLVGTPSYMAPERFEGAQDDLRSDIFSIGIIMYELITGVKPFKGKCSSEVIFNIFHNHPEPVRTIKPAIPEFVEEIISKAMDKEPAKRYQTANEFRSELSKCYDAYVNATGLCELTSVWNVPLHSNINFTGREEMLSQIEQELSSNKILTIHGLGGMGKSQTAAEYAYRHESFYPIIWWIHSEDPSTIGSNYASLAEPLELPSIGMKEKEVVDIVKGRLEREDGWLLIFDNAENPDDIRDYFPKTKTGHILITSRNPHWGGIASTLSLNEMKPEESVKFLLKRTKEKDEKAAEELSETLGRLPLALEQAGSYIETSGRNISEYLEMYKKYNEKLLGRGKPTDYPETVSTTWELSFQRIKVKSEKALELMNLFAFLAPDDIPINILAEGAEHLPETVSSLVSDPFEFDDTITMLRNYSFIKRHQNNLSVHRLVQAVVRDRLNTDEMKIWIEAVLCLMNNSFVFDPNEINSWTACSNLLHHVYLVVMYAEEYNFAIEVVCELLYKMGWYLNNCGDYARGKDLLNRALELGEKLYGQGHPVIAGYLNELAYVLEKLMDHDLAQMYINRAVKIDENVYGPDHPNVARDKAKLGSVLSGLGKLEEAKKQLELAIGIFEKEFSPDHPDVAEVFNTLGVVLFRLGKFEEAKDNHVRALKIYEKALGPDHPEVATVFNNLGMVDYKLGKFEEAKELFERALKIKEKALGPEHPNVAITISNLGMVLFRLGKFEEAKELFERALKIQEKALGPEHPNIARRVYNLGNVFRELGKLEEAKELSERALKIQEKAFGTDHPNVAIAIINLGHVLRELGKLEEAKELFERALKIQEKALGPEHPDVAITISNLGMVLFRLGKLEEAKKLSERALKIHEKTLGPEHPNVAINLKSLGLILMDLGEHDSAKEHLEKAREIYENTFGHDSYQVAGVLIELGKLFIKINELKNVKDHFEQALKIDEKVFGKEHDKVARDLHALGLYFQKSCNIDLAKEHFEKALEIRQNKLGDNHPKTKETRETLLSISE